MAELILIHSPLVGPATWSPVADELRSRGHDVAVPRLSRRTLAGGWPAVVAEIAHQVPDTTGAVFVAHSGAGPLLPTLVHRARAVRPTLVFVDAGIPSTDHATALVPSDMLDELRAMAVDGLLPPWAEWFEPGTVEALLPDRAQRERVVAELPRVPLEYFAATVPAVTPWPAERNGYVLLSDAYDDDALAAEQRGWTVVRLDSDHLGLVSAPAAVADAIGAVVPLG